MFYKQELAQPFRQNADSPAAFLFESIYVFADAGLPGDRPAVVSDILGNHDINMTYGTTGGLNTNGDMVLADHGTAQLNTYGEIQGIDSTDYLNTKSGKGCLVVVDSIVPSPSHTTQRSHLAKVGHVFISVDNASPRNVYIVTRSDTGHGANFANLPTVETGDKLSVVVQHDPGAEEVTVVINGVAYYPTSYTGNPWQSGVHARPEPIYRWIGRNNSWNNYYGWNAPINMLAWTNDIKGQALSEQELIDLCNSPFSILETKEDEIEQYELVVPLNKPNSESLTFTPTTNLSTNFTIDFKAKWASEFANVRPSIVGDIGGQHFVNLVSNTTLTIGLNWSTYTFTLDTALADNKEEHFKIVHNGTTLDVWQNGVKLVESHATTNGFSLTGNLFDDVEEQHLRHFYYASSDFPNDTRIWSFNETQGSTIACSVTGNLLTLNNFSSNGFNLVMPEHIYYLKSDGTKDYDTLTSFVNVVKSLHTGQHVIAEVEDHLTDTTTTYLSTSWKPELLTFRKPSSQDYSTLPIPYKIDARLFAYGARLNLDGVAMGQITGGCNNSYFYRSSFATNSGSQANYSVSGTMVIRDCVGVYSNTHESGIELAYENSVLPGRLINGTSSVGVKARAINSIFLSTDAVLGEDTASYKTAGSRNYFDNCFFKQGSGFTSSLDYSPVGCTFGISDIESWFDSDYNLLPAGRTALGEDTGYQGSKVIEWADAAVLAIIDGTLTSGDEQSVIISGQKLVVAIVDGSLVITMTEDTSASGDKTSHGTSETSAASTTITLGIKEAEGILAALGVSDIVNTGSKSSSGTAIASESSDIANTGSKEAEGTLQTVSVSDISVTAGKLLSGFAQSVIANTSTITVGTKQGQGLLTASSIVTESTSALTTKGGLVLITETAGTKVVGTKIVVGVATGTLEFTINSDIPLKGEKSTTGTIDEFGTVGVTLDAIKSIEAQLATITSSSDTSTEGIKQGLGYTVDTSIVDVIVQSGKISPGATLSINHNQNIQLQGTKSAEGTIYDVTNTLVDLYSISIKSGNVDAAHAIAIILTGGNADAIHITRTDEILGLIGRPHEPILGTVELRYKPIIGTL